MIVALSSESSVALHRSDRDVFRCWCIRRTSPREGSADVPELWLTSPILYRRASALGPLRDCKFFERPLGRVFASGRCSPLPVSLFQQISSFFCSSGAYTPTLLHEQIARKKSHLPWANCLFCACLCPVFDQSRV